MAFTEFHEKFLLGLAKNNFFLKFVFKKSTVRTHVGTHNTQTVRTMRTHNTHNTNTTRTQSTHSTLTAVRTHNTHVRTQVRTHAYAHGTFPVETL